jgi:hypothetical protein
VNDRQKVIILGGKYHGEVVQHESHFALTVLSGVNEQQLYPIRRVVMFNKMLFVATMPDMERDEALMKLLLKPEWFEHWKAASSG